MGSSPSQFDLTTENLEKAELEVLKHSGLDLDQIERRNVKVGVESNGDDIYIRTLLCGDKEKPTLVLVHGFAGSGALFYKIMKTLCSRFYVIFLDIPGMGGSSSPTDFNDKTFSPKQVTQYFVDYFEKWRIEMDNLTGFYLTGHSYGGFMVGHYACQYHQHIKKLLLLSPVGIRCPTEEEYSPSYDPVKATQARFKQKEEEDKANGIKNQPGKKGPPGFIMPLIRYTWKKRTSPFAFVRFAGKGIALKGIKNYVHRRQKVDNEEQALAVRNYMYQIIMRKSTTDCSIMISFSLGFICQDPLNTKDKLSSGTFPIPVSFIYGDSDWVKRVEKEGPQEVVDANPNVGSKLYVIPDSDHNLQMDNPLAFANCIINDILGEDLAIEAPETAQEDYQTDFIRHASEAVEMQQDQEEEEEQKNSQ